MNRSALLVSLLLLVAPACGGDDDGGGGNALPGDPCNGTVNCTPGSICYSNVCVEEGPLRISMSWEDDTDIDLHVLTPAGSEIYFVNRVADEGNLDVDDCIGESCARPGETHVENVFFTDALGDGTYEYWAVNYAGLVATTVTVESFGGSGGGSFDDSLTATSGEAGPHHTVTYP